MDGTERYLMRMADGETVETVWMPDGDGGERGDGSEAAEEEQGEVVGAEEAVAAGVEALGGAGEKQILRFAKDDNPGGRIGLRRRCSGYGGDCASSSLLPQLGWTDRASAVRRGNADSLRE